MVLLSASIAYTLYNTNRFYYDFYLFIYYYYFFGGGGVT